MKLKFIDVRNCHALLPPVPNLSIAKLLDLYLSEHVNNLPGELNGAVDALIRHNENTVNKSRGIRRLKTSQIIITLIYNIGNHAVDITWMALV